MIRERHSLNVSENGLFYIETGKDNLFKDARTVKANNWQQIAGKVEEVYSASRADFTGRLF